LHFLQQLKTIKPLTPTKNENSNRNIPTSWSSRRRRKSVKTNRVATKIGGYWFNYITPVVWRLAIA
jgi:hypothetical protein